MRQTSFAQPREVTAETGDSPESEWFDRFAPDMRDGLVHRVGRIDKAEIGRANHFVTGHLIDETDQFLPVSRVADRATQSPRRVATRGLKFSRESWQRIRGQRTETLSAQPLH